MRNGFYIAKVNERKIPMLAMCIFFCISTGCSTKSALVQRPDKPGSNACLSEFTALKSLDKASYDLYSKQFAEINKSYATYKSQGDKLNKDAKEILGLEIDSKLQLICARVKNSAFRSMQDRSLELNKL